VFPLQLFKASFEVLNTWLQTSIFIEPEINKTNPKIKELRSGTTGDRLEMACSPQGQNMSQN